MIPCAHVHRRRDCVRCCALSKVVLGQAAARGTTQSILQDAASKLAKAVHSQRMHAHLRQPPSDLVVCGAEWLLAYRVQLLSLYLYARQAPVPSLAKPERSFFFG